MIVPSARRPDGDEENRQRVVRFAGAVSVEIKLGLIVA